VTCGRKEKQENEIGESLRLEKRRNEKRPARGKNSPELKDNSQGRLDCQESERKTLLVSPYAEFIEIDVPGMVE
jgi:hypothetical protein